MVKGQTEAPADIQLESTEGDETGPAGIPEFWLNVLRANEVTASQVMRFFQDTKLPSGQKLYSFGLALSQQTIYHQKNLLPMLGS